MRHALLALTLLIAAVRPVAAQDVPLQTQLHALTDRYQGKVALFATDIVSGKTVAIDADRPVPTASVIKLTILFEALKQIQNGQAHFDDALTMTKSDQVPGSGVLTLFDTPQALTLKDALTMMVVVSDNTATNLVIDHLGLDAIDNRIQWMGLQNTWLYKKVFTPYLQPPSPEEAKFGLGKTTAREMAAVMARFATCNLNAPGSPSAAPSPEDQTLCDAALFMLKHQTDGAAIPRYLTVPVANKTGALDNVRNDVAIVYARNGPIVISAFTYDNVDTRWTPDNAGQVLIANLAKLIVDDWQ
jgi:beta-lactamase class A